VLFVQCNTPYHILQYRNIMMLLYLLSKLPSQHDISTPISEHLRHIFRLDPLLFSPLYSILVDCCVGCTPIPPQCLSVLPFLHASSTTQKIATLMMVVYPGMILPSICISVVILPSEIDYMIVIYAIVGGGLLILSNDGIIIIVL